MAKTATQDPFDSACASEGMEEGRNFAPFLDFKKQEGGWVIGILGEGKAVTYVPKKGKNKGKKQDAVYFSFVVSKSGMKTAEEGKEYTISPTGLLLYQFQKGKPTHVKLPCENVGIRYLGRDSEDRHQTEVRWPKP